MPTVGIIGLDGTRREIEVEDEKYRELQGYPDPQAIPGITVRIIGLDKVRREIEVDEEQYRRLQGYPAPQEYPPMYWPMWNPYRTSYDPISMKDLKAWLPQMGDMALDFVPGIGDVKGAQEAITGEILITGEELTPLQRGLAGVSVLPFIPGTIKGLGKKFPRSVHIPKTSPILEKKVVRQGFGLNLSPQSRGFVSYVERNRNLIAIHPNQKTGMSLDFSTSCPKRSAGLGACPYCYVEEARTAKKLGLGFMHGKAVTETPYRREILDMPSDLVRELNRDGGLRTFSFGDFRPGIDDEPMAKVLEDASIKGLYIKAITKQKELLTRFGDHPNIRINISTDNLPRSISNAPTVEEALKWRGGRKNVKIRAVALNEREAEAFAKNPNVDVLTLYHGYTGDKLFQIIKEQNPQIIDKFGGEEKLRRYLDTWQNMPTKSKAYKRLREKYGNKMCCIGGKCVTDPTKCGLGLGMLILGVHLPEFFDDEQ
jgi:hypothetical protein